MPQSKSPTTTTVTESKVLNGAQKAELQATQKANKVAKDEMIELRPLGGDPIQVPVVRKAKTFAEVKVQRDGDEHPRIERYHWHGEPFIHEVNFDRVVAENADTPTVTKSPSDKVKKADCGAALSAIRKPLAEAWKRVDAGDAPGYIEQVRAAIDRCNEAIALAEKMQSQQEAAKK